MQLLEIYLRIQQGDLQLGCLKENVHAQAESESGKSENVKSGHSSTFSSVSVNGADEYPGASERSAAGPTSRGTVRAESRLGRPASPVPLDPAGASHLLRSGASRARRQALRPLDRRTRTPPKPPRARTAYLGSWRRAPR